MKTILSSDQLIIHMRKKGIRFNIINESDANTFISNNNYYLKLAAYRANYYKIPSGIMAGKYVDLEFAYLQELSTIDMHLRYLILKMCLDIEHQLKVMLLNEVENNPLEDGYNLISKFLKKYTDVGPQIYSHRSSTYCKQLIEKHYPKFSVWVFVELISFGVLTKLCSFYNDEYNHSIVNNKLLNSIRDIRNASAHSNCLINNLNGGSNRPVADIVNFIIDVKGIGASNRNNKLSNKFIYDFTVLLYVYDMLIESKGIKHNRYKELNDLFETRMLRNKDYFNKNDTIKTSYSFLKKVVDKVTAI